MRLMSSLPFLAAASLSLTMAACNAEPQGKSFSPEERAAIESIVRDYILEHPEILPEAMEVLRTRMTSAVIDAHRSAIFDDKDTPTAGNPNGDVVIVEFFDYTCGYCKMVEPFLEKVMAEDKGVKIIYKEWPIRGSVAEYASRAALAANAQGKYQAFHNALYAYHGQLTESAVMSVATDVGLDTKALERDMTGRNITAMIERNRKLASDLEFNGTPGFVINNQLIPGAMSYETLKAQIAAARAKKTTSATR